MPCIPPVTSRPRTAVSPRKRSSGPLDGGFQCMASRGSFILSRDSPDSVISGPGPLMPEKRIAPLLNHTISSVWERSKPENATGQRKKRSRTLFFQGGQICWSSFASVDVRKNVFAGSIRRERKTAPGKKSPDAADCLDCILCSVRSARTGCNHFGMRNSGMGICISSYMFMYCAKSK